MRAALMGNMLDRAFEVWTHAEADHIREIDCRLCTTLIEVCARRGDTERALDTYRRMRAAPADSKLAPTVHAYTAAMRAAAEGGQPTAALAIWDDMQGAGCKPTGHAYSAVISSCAAGGEWQRAVTLFDEMMKWGVKPDVVSCTALVTALGADGQWERAEKVVEWMLRIDIRPNVRTYTALVGALANACQWDRASNIVTRMKRHALGSGVEPNAYTYSALLKAMGDHGKWQMAEAMFRELEDEQLTAMQADGIVGNIATAGTVSTTAAVVGDARGESAEERIAADILVTRTAEIALRGLDDDEDEDDAEKRSTSSASTAAAPTGFSYFSAAAAVAASSAGSSSPEPPTTPSNGGTIAAPWTTNNAASRGLQFDLGSALKASNYEKIDLHAIGTRTPAHSKAAITTAPPSTQNVPSAVKSNNTIRANSGGLNAVKGIRGVVNEVVCGALMLAYERAGKWEEAVGVLDRARALGITPNTVMYNTAVSALGKAGQLDAAQELFHACPAPDAVTYETLIAAHGMAGDAEAAEALLREMRAAGHTPQDYAYCGIVAAYSLRGNWKAALKVKDRAAAEDVPPSVHLFNALIAACDRAKQYDKAVELGQDMIAAGITPNSVTQELLEGVRNNGVAAIENQQAAVAALSAAVAAAGTVLMRAGMF